MALKLFVLIWSLLVLPGCECIIQKSYSRLGSANYVTSFEEGKSARSKIDCVRTCRKYSHCISWAFDKVTGTCYLHPSYNGVPEQSISLPIYDDKAPLCSESTAPEDVRGAVTWTRTLTSFYSTPFAKTCPADFMHVASFPVRCLATGQWDRGGEQCKQQIWRNQDARSTVILLPIPKTPVVGWSLCLRATHSANTVFYVELYSSALRAILHIAVRFTVEGYRETVFDSNLNGGWGATKVSITNSFPFTNGQEFEMEIKAINNHQFEVYVYGSLLGTTRPVSATLADIVYARVVTIYVPEINLWCQPV